MPRQLDPVSAHNFLLAQDLIHQDTPIECTSLGGGVSNRVFKLETSTGCFVLKQPLPNLAVEDDWPADVARIHNEANAARAFRAILTDIKNVSVPAVYFESAVDHVVGFECAPSTAWSWKQSLLDGTVDSAIARTLGRVIGTVHTAAQEDETLRQTFSNRRPFEQLRLRPYHRTVAERHPVVEAAIQREITRIEGVHETLVHGDYSPKNILICPDSSVWLLDFEVAHWGDPAFDVAFMLNHLFIKSVHVETSMDAFHEAALAFWDGYTQTGSANEEHVLSELGILLLARIDGKSPVEYLHDSSTKELLRSIAIESITTNIRTIDAFTTLLRTETNHP